MITAACLDIWPSLADAEGVAAQGDAALTESDGAGRADVGSQADTVVAGDGFGAIPREMKGGIRRLPASGGGVEVIQTAGQFLK